MRMDRSILRATQFGLQEWLMYLATFVRADPLIVHFASIAKRFRDLILSALAVEIRFPRKSITYEPRAI